MITTRAIFTSAALGCLTSDAWAGKVTAISQTANGSVLAFDGAGNSDSNGFQFDRGPGVFGPVSFDDCALAGSYKACLNTSNTYLGLGPGNQITGMQASGSLSVVKPATSGSTASSTSARFRFSISQLVPGETAQLRWSGSLLESFNGAAGSIKLVGPGVNLTSDVSSLWDEPLTLGNGEYELIIDASALAGAGQAFNASCTFTTKVEVISISPWSCESSNESCYLPHASAGCDDTLCCEQVCNIDPQCCIAQWDEACVDSTVSVCAATFVSDPVANPLNGHRYRVLAPRSFQTAINQLASSGMSLASIRSGAENAWLTANVASGLPGFTPFSLRLGLNDIASEGTFAWADGTPFLYANWLPSQPDNAFGDQDTVLLDGVTGQWSDVAATSIEFAVGEESSPLCGVGGSCFTTHGPGCNIESCCNEMCFLDPFCCEGAWDSTCASAAQERCAGATVGQAIVNPATRHTYIAVSNGSWLQAQKLAMSMGGNLVSMNSAAENEWVRANFPAIRGNPSQYLIGFNDHAIEGAFQWTSHEPVSFTNWTPGEPNDFGGEDVVILESNGKWNDLGASTVAWAIIEIPCTGDLDDDGSVGTTDLAILLGAWGSSVGAADLDADSSVNTLDLAVLLGAWGPCASSNACFSHHTPGSDQPGCTKCVCDLDPFCCETSWDSICANEAAEECNAACQCGG